MNDHLMQMGGVTHNEIEPPHYWQEIKKIAQRLNVPPGTSNEVDIIMANGEAYSVPAILNAFLDRMDGALSADQNFREAVAAVIGSATITTVIGDAGNRERVTVRKDLFEHMCALFSYPKADYNEKT